MPAFEGQTQEGAPDQVWEAQVAALKNFLYDESVERENFDANGDAYSETPIEGHPAAKALERVDDGDFEAASEYLESEIGKARTEKDVAERKNDQQVQAQWEVRLARLEKLKDSLERQ